MTAGPSTVQQSGRRLVRTGTRFGIVAAMILASLDTLGSVVLASAVDSVTGESILVLSAIVPVLAAGGVIAAWHAKQREMWVITGSLLLLGMVPTGIGFEVVLVSSFVCLGAVAPALTQSESDAVLAAGVLVAVVGLGAELTAHLTGYVSVMALVGGSLVFGSVVCVLGLRGTLQSLPTANRRPRTQITVPLVSGVATERAWYPVWALLLGWSAGVCTLHFTGMMYSLYTQFWWWDLMTHTSSGAGVAAWLYLLRPDAFASPRRLFVFLPAAVFLSGAGFEVYEFVFRGFYEGWSVQYYFRDTVEDMLCNLGGAVVLSLLVRASQTSITPRDHR